MPMGVASSSQSFQAFSDALVWIAQNIFGVGPIVCVLDDFLFIYDSQESCMASLKGFQDMCAVLCVPLRPDKTAPPCHCLTFLCIELGIAAKGLRLPYEKVEIAKAAIA